jgi:hypothetical protein
MSMHKSYENVEQLLRASSERIGKKIPDGIVQTCSTIEFAIAHELLAFVLERAGRPHPAERQQAAKIMGLDA